MIRPKEGHCPAPADACERPIVGRKAAPCFAADDLHCTASATVGFSCLRVDLRISINIYDASFKLSIAFVIRSFDQLEMDPASLSLGILPLVAGAIKAYSGLKKNLEVFRHYSRELRRMRQRLDLERKLFLNETRILVLSAMDDHLLATNMLGNPDHDEWKSAATEDCFRKLLNCSYDEYFDTITNISEAIGEIQTELACFNLFEKERQDVGSNIKRQQRP